MKKLRVFQTIVGIDMPDAYFNGYMEKFFYDDSCDASVMISVINDKMIEPPPNATEESCIPGHTVYAFDGYKYILRSEYDKITGYQYNNEYTNFVITINDTITRDDATVIDALKIEISSVLRRIFIMLAAIKNGVFFHSVSLEYGGEAIAFSAVSETGKTTHANLWKEAYANVAMINGDSAYLIWENHKAYIYGSPWCGTSDVSMNMKAPVKAIVFLEQAMENTIEKLNIPDAFMRLSSRCFMPLWDKVLMLKALNAAEELSHAVNCYLLKCLPDNDAVKVCYNGIYG